MAISGQHELHPADLGALPFESDVNCVVGTVATKLDKPTGKNMLVLAAHTGDWNVRSGDQTSSMPGAFAPASTVSDGSAAFPLHEKKDILIQTGDSVTVKGYDASSILCYYWV